MGRRASDESEQYYEVKIELFIEAKFMSTIVKSN